ncbi:peptidoglycan DD-metalloendopeptidase family protein [Maricaulis sp.]|uniref:peptidoglycan DD-metalloendopeptidase family protein n=1 Tax=Maricaulis sp. TaxID=1486257 RepID=UPI0025BAF15B|nr:peptidoglycan DD-metalloendopeptidase family protein [Maricaulis sp.]
MSGLFEALVVGAALSLVSGLCALAFAGWLTGRGRGGAGLWRVARWAALAPLLLAPVIYFIPETMIAPMHAPLPDGPPRAGGAYLQQTSGLDPAAIMMSINWLLVLAGLYLAGLLVALAGAALRHHRRARLLAASRPAPEIAQDYLSVLASRVGVETPDFRLRDGLASPLLTGWNPVILAAPDLLDDMAASRYALTHELVHYRRGDEQDRLLGAALMVALWFHWPLRRIERELHEAREIDCDSESLETLGDAERKPYASTLITMMRSPARLVSAFGPDDRRHREMRIKAILSGRSARPSSRLLAVMLAGVSVLPVACAQAALTERTQLAVNLENPAANHAVRFYAAPDGETEAGGDHEHHFSDELHEEHAFGPDSELHEHDGTDGDMVFRTEDGRTLIFTEADPDEDGNLEMSFGDAGQNMMFIPEGGEGEIVFFSSEDGETREFAFTDEAGNTMRFDGDVDVDVDWRTEDGDYVFPEAPVAPERVEPTREPAPRGGAREPFPAASRTPEATPTATSEPKPAEAPRALRRVEPPAPASFFHPVAAGRVTSHFGNRPSRPAGAEADHGGIDIAAPSGTPILAAAGGTVRHAEAGYNGWPAWGNTVVIDHGNGWETLYAHMQDIEVGAGATVAAGEEIGTVGSTGRSTGPHLHLEVRHNGQRVDPAAHVTGLR